MPDAETPTEPVPVDAAGHPLWSAVSRARGYCDGCRRAQGEDRLVYGYTRIPDPGPKLRAAMEEMGDE